MNIHEAFEKSGLSGTIDTATPQAWYDEVSKLYLDPRDYVWWYPEGDGIFGWPLLKHRIYLFSETGGGKEYEQDVRSAYSHT